MPGSAMTELYSAAEVRVVLGLSKGRLDHLVATNLLAYRRLNQANFGYLRSYIDGLAALQQIGATHGYATDDPVYMRLSYLRYQYYDCAPPTRSLQNVHQKKINDECARLVKTGRAVRLDTFSDMMENYASRHAISWWARTDKLATVKVGMTRYMSHAYAVYVRNIFATWPSLYDISADLGIPYSSLVSQCTRVKFTTFKMPDGITRVNPAQLNLTPPPDMVVLGVAAARIGVGWGNLARGARQASIKVIADVTYIEEEEVAYWMHRFNTINEGFEWLHEESRLLGGMKLSTPKQVRSRLGLAIGTLTKWFAEDLLPYYIRSFDWRRSSFRMVPARYVDGLLRYATAGHLPMLRATGRQYRELCIERRLIV
jgi:hypothetical protein